MSKPVDGCWFFFEAQFQIATFIFRIPCFPSGFRFREELDELTVKQLKEVLMLNRVDFKGCCEKSELLERVQRLWDDLQNCPGNCHWTVHRTTISIVFFA